MVKKFIGLFLSILMAVLRHPYPLQAERLSDLRSRIPRSLADLVGLAVFLRITGVMRLFRDMRWLCRFAVPRCGKSPWRKCCWTLRTSARTRLCRTGALWASCPVRPASSIHLRSARNQMCPGPGSLWSRTRTLRTRLWVWRR